MQHKKNCLYTARMHNEEVDPLGWRLADSVVRGEIDSRQRDRITGRIWLIDRKFPIELTLRGNPMRDIAGCLLEFENPNPMPEDNEGLSPIQMGEPGIITASHKVQVVDIASQGVDIASQSLAPITKVGNAIWIEWFSNANGRVVMQATDFHITISSFSWRMTREEEQNQRQRSEKSHQQWREIVASENGDGELDFFDDFEEDDDWYMDEFAWERQFQESDAVSRRYMLLMETYLNHPDRDALIAHEMGWTGGEGDSFEEEDLDWEDEGIDWEETLELATSLAPIPETEGIDWIRSADGRIRHPLSQSASDIVQQMWRMSKEYELQTEEQSPDMQAMLFHAQTMHAKLAGALDSLAYQEDPDGGFVVACLKRALQSFVLTIKSLGSVAQCNLLPPQFISTCKDDLFAIRQEILRLMQHYRHINDI